MPKQKTFISDLIDETAVETIFLAAKKSVRETRNGDPYLCVTLQDRTGVIEARGWDNAAQLESRFDVEDFVAVRGRVSSYRGELQITIADLERVSEDVLDLADFLPHSRWDKEKLFQELTTLVEEQIESSEVRRFLQALFDDESWRRRYCRAPAAVSNHHAYLAGLLEHSLSMARLAVQMGRHYGAYYPGFVDVDLLVAGCIIHDMAKIEELEYRRTFDYTTEGRLIGHIVRGSEIVAEVAQSLTPELDENLTTQLKHLVLSHHGKKEYGAPVTPKSPEAMLLHHLDMIDSRMNMSWNACQPLVEDEETDEGWSDYQRTFGSFLYISGEAARGWQDSPRSAASGDGPGIAPENSADNTASSTTANTGDSTSTRDNEPTEPNLELFED